MKFKLLTVFIILVVILSSPLYVTELSTVVSAANYDRPVKFKNINADIQLLSEKIEYQDKLFNNKVNANSFKI